MSQIEGEASSGDVRGLAVVVASPKAGAGDGGKAIETLVSQLRARDWECKVYTDIDEAQGFVGHLSGEIAGRCVLVAAGGDGTLNLVASKMPQGFAIVPMPLGTENLVAQHFGLTSGRKMPEVSCIVEAVVNGKNTPIDSGLAIFPKAHRGRGDQRRFLIMATAGLDAEVVRRMHYWRSGHISRWSYFKPIVAGLRKYHYPRISVYREGSGPLSEQQGRWGPEPWLTVGWGMVFNLPRYGGGLRIEPKADGHDGLLDFCGFIRGSFGSTLKYLLGIVTGTHHRWGDVVRAKGGRFRMESRQPVAVQLDGDYAGRLPVEIEICPASVLLRVPRKES